MDIQALKIELVQKILDTQNLSILSKVHNIFQKEAEKDWWDQLPSEVQDSIMEGVQDIEEGKIFTNEEVIQEARQKYGY